MLECGDGEEILCLPVLGQEYTPGTPLVTYQFLVTRRTTKADVREKLKQYGRPVSGNREEVLQRLQAFSEDNKEWLSLFQPKLKRKRGEHTSRKTLSQKRVEDTFGAAPPTLTYKSKKSADRTQRALTDKDRSANTSWATAVFSAFGMPMDFSCAPALPKHRRTQIEPAQQTLEVPADSELTGCGSLHEQESFAVCMRRVENNVQSVRDDIYNIEGSINKVATHVMDVKSLVSRSTLSPICENHIPHQAQHPMGQSAGTTTAVLPSSSQPLNLALLCLAMNGFEYDKTRVPEPPTIHLSKDIDRLCKEWESSNLLCVGGRGIPVKYWGEFYKRAKGAKTTAWDALRAEWGNWKFIARGAASVIQILPPSGVHSVMEMARNFLISKSLTASPSSGLLLQLEMQIMHCTFFGGNLDHPLAQGAFRYAKGSKTYLLQKDGAIAKKWRELLSMRPDISSVQRDSSQ
ncbi:uncharacterized protein EDB93DRAFT_1104353 [Suillus bovinus]|uniref:uncharacterized protein n=1 Tax=Suillus bovinus TaxID=48563 RepID=UPI001B8709D4|nr:uncharacterized protein EDB93DRAFT_1104353 [Suillus bovinus]KAG2146596.1 hypothetical protein EDB93DRAFT_1104353 [Suillus bovinus]